MTPKDKLAAALKALDYARRALDSLAVAATGDDDVDNCVADALETIEAEIVGATYFKQQ